MTDTITTCLSDKLMTKRISLFESSGLLHVEDYGRASRFYYREYDLTSIEDILRFLKIFASHDRTCVIRGRPLFPDCVAPKLRRLHARNGEEATIEACARYWVALDIDKFMRVPDVDVNVEPDPIIYAILEELPEEFQTATCVYQFTSSQGIKPGLSVRLWFWLARRVTDAELKIIFKGKPVDPSVFAPVQPIYTAAPIFVPPMRDPLAPERRVGIIRGSEDAVTIGEIKPPERRRAPDGGWERGEPPLRYETIADTIGDDGDGFFGPIKSAVASYFGRYGTRANPAWLAADLERRIRAAYANPAKRDPAENIELRVRDLNETLIPWYVRAEAERAEERKRQRSR